MAIIMGIILELLVFKIPILSVCVCPNYFSRMVKRIEINKIIILNQGRALVEHDEELCLKFDSRFF